jgi:hypothetical protein
MGLDVLLSGDIPLRTAFCACGDEKRVPVRGAFDSSGERIVALRVAEPTRVASANVDSGAFLLRASQVLNGGRQRWARTLRTVSGNNAPHDSRLGCVGRHGRGEEKGYARLGKQSCFL